MIEVAAIDPVSSALPSAVTHNPMTRALAFAAPVWVYFVPAGVCTVSVVGAAVVAVLLVGRMLSMVKPVALTAVTLPKAPSPPKPPAPLPPRPGPRVRPGFGVPAAPFGCPDPPRGRAPPVRSPPAAEHLPFTAAEISTVAATIGPDVLLGAVVGGGPPVPAAGRALRAWTHTPTTTSEIFAATVLVNVVVAE
jgi:hypothetical protein